ncbi:MFS transporter [Zhongshania marina]|uniref:MFS transporter n=1 Tax=Zhongshania marina TaxID=2304603 RepID=A0A2S4HEN2_9GAMM|nr:MFS transporter [Marortus luteolus]POP52427.1 MFS transporter [Marortus luteolus]
MSNSAAAAGKSGFKAMFTLYLAMMCVGMGQTVVFAILPMLGRELHLDLLVFNLPFSDIVIEPRELAITSLSALTAFVFFVAAPKWGRLSDRWGRKPLIIFGLFGYVAGTLAFNGVAYLGLSGALVGTTLLVCLIISRAFHAVVMSATHPASAAYMVDVTSVYERTKGMGKLQACNQLGVMVGPALAWFVTFNYLAPLYIQAAVALIVGLLVCLYLPAIPPANTTGRKQAKLAYFDPRYRKFIILGFIIYSLLGMVQQTLGFYFQDILAIDGVRAAQLFSSAMVVSSVAILLAQFGVVRSYSGLPMGLLRIGLPFMLLSYLLLANATALWMLYLAMGLFGFGMGLTGPSFTASATMAVESHEQGGLAGLIGAIAGLGFMFGPLIGGGLYRLSPSYPYWCSALVMMVIILSLSILDKSRKK